LPTTLRRTELARMRMSPWITMTLPVQVPVLALLSATNLSAEMLMGALESCLPMTEDGAAANAGAAERKRRTKSALLICGFRSRSCAHFRPAPADDWRDHNEKNRPAWCPSGPVPSLRYGHAPPIC